MYLTVNSLIDELWKNWLELVGIIVLWEVNFNGWDKIYMDKTLTGNTLYQLIDHLSKEEKS